MPLDNTTTPSPMGWNFDNSYAALPELFYRRLSPVPVRAPKLVIFNRSLATELGLDPQRLQTDEGVNILAGNALPAGAQPLAQAYAGHQFGHFTTLGDGRAILLGEQITPTGERLDIQLKGSGRTPFSRQGDGRAALGPMLREYVISEAMYALGIPTTRSLAVVSSGEPVRRETLLPGAVLTRVAASHLRVGTFEYAAWQGTPEQVKMLADYSIRRHYPEAAPQENPYLAFFEAVMDRQAALIVKWLLVGFIHGVMNTDNMAISGETIDYGPCAFMDIYNPGTVFSSIDHHGRYAFANQAHIAQWNLARFAETLLPLFADGQEKAIDLAHTALKGFEDRFQDYWLKGMRAKLGLADAQEGDARLIEELLKIMQRLGADYTNSFRDLAREASPDTALFQDGEFQDWQQRWRARLEQQGQPLAEVRANMDAHNPAVIPRNHRVEEALAAAAEEGDIQPLEKLLGVLATPYAEPAEADQAYRQPPEPSNRVYQTFCGT